MNYGKEHAAKQAARLSGRSKKRKRHSAGLAVIRLSLICIVSVFVAGGIIAYLYASSLINKLPDASDVNIAPEGYKSTVYDSTGAEIDTLKRAGSNRTEVKIDDLPEYLPHAFVAIEDARFYEHNGIDLQGIVRAAVTGITSGNFSQGASTITQQLLKNGYFATVWAAENSFKDRLNRKIQEQYLAVQIEKIYSKERILECYLNSINLGQNSLGVESAAKRYFGKSAKDLTLSESAVIAGITQNPSKYNPISHPEDNAKRRKKVLNNMLEQKYIDKAQYDEAIADNVYDRISLSNDQYNSKTSSYFVDALIDQVLKDLMEQKGYSKEDAEALLYSGGLKINATQDPAIQAIVDEEINREENYKDMKAVSFQFQLTVNKADGTQKNYSQGDMFKFYHDKDENYNLEFESEEAARAAIEQYKIDANLIEEGDTVPEGEAGERIAITLQPQAAMTIIDQSTGQVVALTGGRGEKSGSRTLNRATGTTRQPGSTFKVIACYAAALDSGKMTLASVENDIPSNYTNSPKQIKNYNNQYLGWTNIRTAITNSINVVTVRVLRDIGTGLGYQYAQNLGITTLVDGDNNEALALGGITKGVKNIELTAAYATIANHGEYNKPVFYTTVEGRDGKVILDNRENQSKPVLKETTAWLLTSAMQDVMTKGTGKNANFEGMHVAGKSGTTTKNKDTLFAGFTPYYTAVIWGGYDDNTEQKNTSYSKAIWKAVMSRVHEGLADKDFPQPEGIVTQQVCSKSGKLAIDGVCTNDPRGSMVYTEYFEKGTEPTETCDHHYLGTVCTETHMFANSGCPCYSGVFIIGAGAGGADEKYGVDASKMGQYCPIHGGYPMPNSGAPVGGAPIGGDGGGGTITPAPPGTQDQPNQGQQPQPPGQDQQNNWWQQQQQPGWGQPQQQQPAPPGQDGAQIQIVGGH